MGHLRIDNAAYPPILPVRKKYDVTFDESKEKISSNVFNYIKTAFEEFDSIPLGDEDGWKIGLKLVASGSEHNWKSGALSYPEAIYYENSSGNYPPNTDDDVYIRYAQVGNTISSTGYDNFSAPTRAIKITDAYTCDWDGSIHKRNPTFTTCFSAGAPLFTCVSIGKVCIKWVCEKYTAIRDETGQTIGWDRDEYDVLQHYNTEYNTPIGVDFHDMCGMSSHIYVTETETET